MNEKTFSKKLISLRKKAHLTQQELADKLNVSNKTISRWETAEGYPDVELLPKIAEIFHVSIDYLLKDHDDFKEIDKHDIIPYVPWIISFGGLITYFLSITLSIPIILSFVIYYFLIRYSYRFLNKYTDRQNRKKLAITNSIFNFFVTQSFAFSIMTKLYLFSETQTMFIVEQTYINEMNMPLVNEVSTFFYISYMVAFSYAIIHYFLSKD